MEGVRQKSGECRRDLAVTTLRRVPVSARGALSLFNSYRRAEEGGGIKKERKDDDESSVFKIPMRLCGFGSSSSREKKRPVLDVAVFVAKTEKEGRVDRGCTGRAERRRW